jgi:hypothetical protein
VEETAEAMQAMSVTFFCREERILYIMIIPAWMINKIIGFDGLYTTGLPPSSTPP